MSEIQPGSILLLGSGETAPAVQRVYHSFFEFLKERPRIAILETPAGFEPNSGLVAQEIVQFIEQRLPNFKPQVRTVPARRSDGKLSTNNPEILEPLLSANVILTGPGSPTYAIKHFGNSLCWDYMRVCNLLGQHLFLSSSATVAAGAVSLPVYEIYKVGMDLFWQKGLDLLGDFGLNLTVIPHWNNNSGGTSLDTSRCYMGQERFSRLLDLLPADSDHVVLGIDENTAVHIKPSQGTFAVLGKGKATFLRDGSETSCPAGIDYPLTELGDWHVPASRSHIEETHLNTCLSRRKVVLARESVKAVPPPQVQRLLEERARAREVRSWTRSDELRDSIREAGWDVKDSTAGQVASPLED